MTRLDEIHRAQLLRRRAPPGGAAAGGRAAPAAGAPGAAGPGPPAPPRGLALRGVTYDTGIDTLGELSRLRWSRRLMEGELDAIRDGLHCNAVSIAGTRIERLAETASAALHRDLH